MINAVYLSTEAVQIAIGQAKHGKIRLASFVNQPLPEGAMLNGVITDDNACQEVLKDLVANSSLPTKKVDLVIDSSSILMKKVAIPPLSHKKILQIIRNEFLEFGDAYDDLLYDYAVQETKSQDHKGGIILCSAVERWLIGSYIDLFAQCGVRLRSINLALAAQIRIASFFPELQDTTYILAVLEGNSIVSSLFADGKYLLTNRTRLLAEHGTPDSTKEITNTVSSLIQFNKAQKNGFDITHAYLCGLHQEEIYLCGDIAESLGIAVTPLPDFAALALPDGGLDYHLANALYVTGNLLEKGDVSIGQPHKTTKHKFL